MRIVTQEQIAGCWVATTEEYGGPGWPIGSSTRSESDAVADLLDQLDDAEFAAVHAVGETA